MKKFLTLFFFIFAFRHAVADYPGVIATTVVGPFKSEAECKAAYDEAFESVGGFPGMEFAKCVERKDA
jgi:hypothetical protein